MLKNEQWEPRLLHNALQAGAFYGRSLVTYPLKAGVQNLSNEPHLMMFTFAHCILFNLENLSFFNIRNGNGAWNATLSCEKRQLSVEYHP
jgi:hypothetical protein